MISRGRGDNSGRNIGTVQYRFVTAWLRQAGDDTDKGYVYRQAPDVHSFDLWQFRVQFTKVKNGSAKTRFLLLGPGPYDVRTKSDVNHPAFYLIDTMVNVSGRRSIDSSCPPGIMALFWPMFPVSSC